jgi:hypothetical protein
MINHADRPCRVNCYGSSFTDCEQVNDGETWQERLAAHLGEPIRNYGVGGQTSYHSLVRMRREEERTPAPYIIVNLTPPYERQLFGWQSLLYTKSPKHPSPPMPFVRVNRARSQYQEVPSPCPTAESLYRFCDLDWVYQIFKDDFGLQIMVARDLLRKGHPERAYQPTMALAHEHGIDRVIDRPDTLEEVLNALMTQEAIYATLRTIEKVQEYADQRGKKVLYVLTYGSDVIETAHATGKRFDQEVVNRLRSRGLPYADLLAAYAADYAAYRVPFSEYLKRHFVGGHINPVGNAFIAYTIKDKLVKLMRPKPPAYDPNGTGG